MMKICADRQLISCLEDRASPLVQNENKNGQPADTKCAVLSSIAAPSAAANAVHHKMALKIAAPRTAPGTAAPIFDK